MAPGKRRLTGEITMKRTLVTLSILSLLAACGGGSDSKGTPVNPVAVQQTQAPAAKPAPVAPTAPQSWSEYPTRRPGVNRINAAYRELLALVSDPIRTEATAQEKEAIADLEGWYFTRFGMLVQNAQDKTGGTKAGLMKTAEEMKTMRQALSDREYAGRIMSAVYPAMLVKPEEWREPVIDYYKALDIVLFN